MERGFTAETDARVLVMLDARAPESEEALDQALRVTASLCVHFARRGGCLLSLPDDARPSPIEPDLRAWPALHARLALVRSGTGTTRHQPRAGARTLLYVTASTDAPAPAGRCYRLGPRPLAGLDVTFTVAGFAVQAIERAQVRAA
jgi:UDP:flavonoid glycosyltransferase YjiC (YdhE family)